MNIIYSTPLLITGFINIGLMFFIIMENPRLTLNRIFSALAFLAALWALSSVMQISSHNSHKILFWSRISATGYISLAAVYLHFTIAFSETRRKFATPRYLLIYTPVTTFLYLVWTSNLIIRAPIKLSWGYVNVYGPYYYAYTAYLCIYLIAGIYICSREHTIAQETIRRKQAQLLISGSTVLLLSALTTNILMPVRNVFILGLGSIIATIPIAIFAFAMQKYQHISLTSTFAADTIISTLQDGLFVLDLNKRILIANPFITDLLQYKKHEILNKPITNFVLEGKEFFDEAIWPKLLNKTTIKNYSITYLTKELTTIPVSFSATTINDEHGQVTGIVCVARDMRVSQKLIDELRRASLFFDEKVKVRKRELEQAQTCIEESYIRSVDILAKAIDEKDSYTHRHSDNVTRYSVSIAKNLGFHPEQVEVIRRACHMHDIGKIAVSDTILNKPGKLTDEEWNEIKQHPKKGAEILMPLSFLKREIECIKHHHERFDGNGYPDGLKGEKIVIGARIIAVADAFDAMMSDRPYRKAFSLEEALSELNKNSGTQFDPKIVDTFINIVRSTPNIIQY